MDDLNHTLCTIGTGLAAAECFVLGWHASILLGILLWTLGLALGSACAAFIGGAVAQHRQDRIDRQRRYEARWRY